MSRNPEKKELKTKPKETEETISSQEGSSPSEKTQVGKTEAAERFEEKIISKVKDIEPGALFAGAENLFDRVKKLDAQITMNANGLFSKVTGYLRDSIDSHKKTGK